MKIGLGSTTIAPSPNHSAVGGMSTYTRHLLQDYQQRADMATMPCYFSHLYQFRQPNPWSQGTAFPLPYAPSVLRAQALKCSFSSAIERQIELFHATDYLTPYFKHIPVITTLHDAAPLKYPQWCNPTLRRTKNWLLKSLLKYVDQVITISYAMVPDLVTYWGVEEKKISVIHLGVDESWFTVRQEAEKTALLTRYHLSPNYILFAGSFQPRKNLDNLVDAYIKLPQTVKNKHPLLLVGDFHWPMPTLKKKIQQLIADGHAVIMPFVTPDELQILFQCAKLFAFPSLYEGFGLPILEAFAAQVPVITSNVSSCPEVAGEAAYLVNPYSVDEIYNAMKTLLADDDLCRAQIAKGYQRAREMTWGKCARQTIDVYRRVLGS